MKPRKKNKPSDKAESLLKRRLAEFAADKTKEKYVYLLDALRHTDVLVPVGCSAEKQLSGNEDLLQKTGLKAEAIYISSLQKHLMPIFSDPTEIPAGHITGKTVFMHCSGWIKAFRSSRCEGVILNPFSDISFVLTPDQIRVLFFFGSAASEDR